MSNDFVIYKVTNGTTVGNMVPNGRWTDAVRKKFSNELYVTPILVKNRMIKNKLLRINVITGNNDHAEIASNCINLTIWLYHLEIKAGVVVLRGCRLTSSSSHNCGTLKDSNKSPPHKNITSASGSWNPEKKNWGELLHITQKSKPETQMN